MIHSCIRVRDLSASIDFYRSVFELQEYARYAFETFTLVYLRAPGGSFELELTCNHDRDTPYQLGDGYGHLAVLVDGLDGVLERYRTKCQSDAEVKELRHEGSLLGRFFFATDPDGYKIEVLDKAGRFAEQEV
jgi:lactoylglutathione lyase